MAASRNNDSQWPADKASLAARVADSLVAFILEEGLKSGDPLPPTAELAERYGVSRTVVREAIADLAGRGLLQRSQGKESIVAAPGRSQLHGLLQFRVLHDGVSAEEVMELRRAIETITARLAAERRQAAHLSALEAALDDLFAARDDMSFHDADVRFHHLLAVATGNRLITLIFEGIESLVRELRIRATAGRRARGESFGPILEAHRAIFDAVTDQDADAAETAMIEHLRQAEEGLKALREMRGIDALGRTLPKKKRRRRNHLSLSV